MEATIPVNNACSSRAACLRDTFANEFLRREVLVRVHSVDEMLSQPDLLDMSIYGRYPGREAQYPSNSGSIECNSSMCPSKQ
jgi:hypothetical protein